eukprot:gene17003-23281_t
MEKTFSWLWGTPLLADYIVEVVEEPRRQGDPNLTRNHSPRSHRLKCHGLVLCQAHVSWLSPVPDIGEDESSSTAGISGAPNPQSPSSTTGISAAPNPRSPSSNPQDEPSNAGGSQITCNAPKSLFRGSSCRYLRLDVKHGKLNAALMVLEAFYDVSSIALTTRTSREPIFQPSTAQGKDAAVMDAQLHMLVDMIVIADKWQADQVLKVLLVDMIVVTDKWQADQVLERAASALYSGRRNWSWQHVAAVLELPSHALEPHFKTQKALGVWAADRLKNSTATSPASGAFPKSRPP